MYILLDICMIVWLVADFQIYDYATLDNWKNNKTLKFKK